MKRLVSTLVAVSFFSFACGPLPAGTEVAIADQSAALTANGDDVLFELTLAASDAPISVADISVHAGLPGQTATVVNFTHADGNSDGKLDPGETLTTREPGVNLFDTSHVGKTINIGLAERNSNGVFMTRASASWTPAQ